jgi:RNA polymerase sigma-70 factor (family 1)
MQKERSYGLTLAEYKKLFTTFYPTLCYFASKYTNNIEVSKDIAQDVFIKVWEDKISFDSADKVKSFLYIAVKNKSLDYLKSGQNRFIDKIETPDVEIASESHFLREVMIVETTLIIENAISALPKKCAQIIKLSLKEYTNDQIAGELSLSINTIKAQKRIAYQKLRSLLKDIFSIF